MCKGNGKKVFEDKKFVLTKFIQGFMQPVNGIVDEVTYATNDANRCTIMYHDDKGSGRLKLFTNSRSSRQIVSANSNQVGFECSEQLRQVSVRNSIDSTRRPSQILGDYMIRWKFFPDDESKSVDNASAIRGEISLYTYLLPQDELFFKRPSKPLGLFRYTFKMRKA